MDRVMQQKQCLKISKKLRKNGIAWHSYKYCVLYVYIYTVYVYIYTRNIDTCQHITIVTSQSHNPTQT